MTPLKARFPESALTKGEVLRAMGTLIVCGLLELLVTPPERPSVLPDVEPRVKELEPLVNTTSRTTSEAISRSGLIRVDPSKITPSPSTGTPLVQLPAVLQR